MSQSVIAAMHGLAPTRIVEFLQVFEKFFFTLNMQASLYQILNPLEPFPASQRFHG